METSVYDVESGGEEGGKERGEYGGGNGGRDCKNGVDCQDYVRTARAKGVTDFMVVLKHTLRNALIPVITYVGPMIAYILTGSMVVETVFNIGGLGTKFVSAINNQDYPMIMGTTIFLATLMVIMTLLSDIVYKIVDPKISFE